MRVLIFLLTAGAALMALQPPAFADCTCRANGHIYNHGQVVCLKLPDGEQLARCDMELNNSAWKKVRDGCPMSALAPLPMSTPNDMRNASEVEKAG